MPSYVCENCGMSEDLCVCHKIDRAEEKVVIKLDEHTGEKTTSINDIESSEEMNTLEKTLNSKLECKGSLKQDHIELQGNHVGQVKDILIKKGYKAENIDVEK